MPKVHYELFCHFVWHTKDDKPYIDEEVEHHLFACIGQKCKQEGYHLIAINGTQDHIHVLLSLRPTQLISDAAHALKGSSSHDVNKHFQGNKCLYWQNGYGVLTVSKNSLEKIKEYISNQKEHHKTGKTLAELEERIGSEEP
jgi:putative transposase